MKIRVTKNDILMGESVKHLDRSQNCPISQACKRHLFEWGEFIRTLRTEITFASDNYTHYHSISLPPEATLFIDRFDDRFDERIDRDMPLLPFEFDINSEKIEKPVKITLDEPTEPLECELVKV